MFKTPLKLRELCLEYLAESISVTSCQNDIVINGSLTEELLKSLSFKNKLTDEILLMSIFDSKTTQLRHVCIPDASQLTTRGLGALKTHRINELEVCGLINCTFNELIGCLGEWSQLRLRYLNVAHSAFTISDEFCAKLQHLQELDVSHTEFNDKGLEIVVKNLPHLQCLNISATRVQSLKSLRKYKDRLKSLSLYNLRSTSGSCEVSVLKELSQLVHLDISDESGDSLDMLTLSQDCPTQILRHPQCFKHLKSLDLSGRDSINSEELKKFITYKQQSSCESLKFLGLMNTTVCFEDIFSNDCYDSNLIITGNATEAQIVESLRLYKHRPTFVEESLLNIHDHLLTYREPRTDLIDLIVIQMRENSKIIGIQMAAIACLYNLTNDELSENIHPNVLKNVVDVTLNAMILFPNHQQLQKISLLTLYNDRILNDVSFDRIKCIQLVMDYLVAFKDVDMNEYAVYICSIIARRILPNEKSKLGSEPVYMETLLDIIRSRSQLASNDDFMLEFTLRVITSLSDETPKTCEMFIEKGGIESYLFVLNKFVGQNKVETSSLILLNNIADVSYLRANLMKLEFITVLRNLMHSTEINVSFLAAGIFAKLCSDGIKCWSCSSIDFNTIIDELMNVIQRWKASEEDMISFRSFLSFLPLLNNFESTAVQLWAIWTIHHVCSRKPKLYCKMLIEENIAQCIKTIYETSRTDKNESFLSLCGLTLDVIKKEFPNFIH